MGFDASFILIKTPSVGKIKDQQLLKELALRKYVLSKNTTLEVCMASVDTSVNIGEYNNCLIICDSYTFSQSVSCKGFEKEPAPYEEALADIFPDSEILTVACIGSINYHLYSLVVNRKKLRYKRITPGRPRIEYGERLREEEAVYARSKEINGELLFAGSGPADNQYVYTEDQMMEEFAFGVARRHLGVMISTVEDEELMFRTVFRKYIRTVVSKGGLSRLFGKSDIFTPCKSPY